MKNRYDILERAPQVELTLVHALLKDFLSYAIVKEKRQRWLDLSMKPERLYSKFSGLWNGLDTTKALKMYVLELPSQEYIYYCMDDYGYLLSASDACIVGGSEDGFLFDKRLNHVYFLTHESEYYLYKLPKKRG